MAAIVTKYLGPTDHRGTRISARVPGETGGVIIARHYGNRVEEDHRRAAVKLAKKLEWPGVFVGDYLTASEMVWVPAYGRDRFTIQKRKAKSEPQVQSDRQVRRGAT